MGIINGSVMTDKSGNKWRVGIMYDISYNAQTYTIKFNQYGAVRLEATKIVNSVSFPDPVLSMTVGGTKPTSLPSFKGEVLKKNHTLISKPISPLTFSFTRKIKEYKIAINVSLKNGNYTSTISQSVTIPAIDLVALFKNSGRPAEGVYEIQSCMDPSYIMDLSGDTDANKATIQIYTRNNGISGTGNHQRFILKHIDTNYSMLITGRNAGKVVEIYGRTKQTGLKEGNNVSQYDFNNSICQKWKVSPVGSSSLKLAYYLKSAINNNYVMDIQGAKKANSQNIVVHTRHANPGNVAAYGDNQKFYFAKSFIVDKSLPVPAVLDLAHGTEIINLSSGTRLSANESSQKKYLHFVCNWNKEYFFRYRYRRRKHGETAYGSWSAWMSNTGNTANSGWVDPWAYGNLNPRYTNGGSYGTVHVESGHPITVPITGNNGYDKYEYQLELRTSDHHEIKTMTKNKIPLPLSRSSFVGLSKVQTVTILYRAQLNLTTARLTAKGIRIYYNSTLVRGGNKFTFGRLYGSKGMLTNRTYTKSNAAYSSYIDIPFSELIYIPSNGEKLTMSASLVTVDGYDTGTISKTLTLTYDNNMGIAVSATFTKADGAIIKAKPKFMEGYVELSKSAAHGECHIIYEQDAETIISECEYIGGNFIIIPPSNKDYRVLISAWKDEKTWGSKSYTGAKVSVEGQMFNFGTNYFRLFLQGEEPYQEQSLSYTANSSTYQFEGDRRQTVYFGKGASVTQTVNGLCPISNIKLPGAVKPYPAKCFLYDFHNLRNNKYAVYRDLYGRRYQVAVTATTEEPYKDNLFKVSMTLTERM